METPPPDSPFPKASPLLFEWLARLTDHIRSAFSPRAPEIRFYYPQVLGEAVAFTDLPHATYVNFNEPGEPFAIRVATARGWRG